MSEPFHDAELDALLREVPLPDGFVQRLSEALAPAAERLDESLRAVPVPSTMLARLKEIPADAELDASLADVAAPPALVSSLRRPTWPEQLWRASRQVTQATAAASWFVALSLLLAAVGLLSTQHLFFSPVNDPLELVVTYDRPIPAAASAESAALESEVPNPLAALDSQGKPGAPQIALIAPPDLGDPLRPGPVGQWVNVLRGGLRPLDDAVLLRYGLLGAPHSADDRLPELVAPRLPRPTGIEPPPVRGYDRAFFLKHRVFPPIPPSANPKLAALDVPLVTFSDVLTRLERTLAEVRVPAAADLRTEELLAAMDYRLPAAASGKLAIRTAAGPSLFGGPDVGLLQVAVQAGGLGMRPQTATHLVLAIDASHTMGVAGRLEMVKAAVSRLLDQLTPRDRLSVVIFDEEIRHIVEALAPEDAASLRELLAGLAPRGGTNLAGGIQQAASLAMNDAAGSAAARRLVLITDSEPLLPPETAERVEQVLADAAATGVQFDVLDVSYREQVDSQLVQWATSLSGQARRIADGRQLYRALLESLAGRDPAIAHDARLTLRFNPKSVAAYRLIGHEANALADITPASAEAAILAGESATALVELWFTPDDLDDLGVAELTWNDPATGAPARVRQRISRVQFAATAREMPLPLVQAALAAQVGEVLHGSHDVLRQAGLRPASSRGLAGVLEAAKEANPRLHERADLERLLRLAEQLQKQGVK
ncbi:MAG TPA: YfbK domain-containing protein [Pirellulaceae bacterium]|nr:YfbK domain-containing protein [Pirellulaceae bacterium]